MSLWKQLLNRNCSHQFGWPRVHADGRHYQICILCGTAYEYDWTMMCRTDRLMAISVPYVSEDNRVSGPRATFPKQQGQ